MLPPATIEMLRQHLARGADIWLELSDGSELSGSVAYVGADGVRLDGMPEPFRFEVIEDLLVDISPGGIE
jgi:hypothetical protein